MYPPTEASKLAERIRADPALRGPDELNCPEQKAKSAYLRRPSTQASAWPLLGACGRAGDGRPGSGACSPGPRTLRPHALGGCELPAAAHGAPPVVPGALELPGVPNRQEEAARAPTAGGLGLPGVASRRVARAGEAELPPSYVTESVTTPAGRVQPRPVPLASTRAAAGPAVGALLAVPGAAAEPAASPASHTSTLTSSTATAPVKLDSCASFPWAPERALVQSWHRKLTDTYQDYSMVNVVGKGRHGAVFIVQKKSTGRKYACKLLSKAEHFPSMMRREIDLLRRLDHPNVVRLYETNEDKEAVFLLMELCHGGDLFQRIFREGRLSEDIARPMAEQMLQALAYIHAVGVAHHDLKPENFLLETEDPACLTLKLADFGIATATGHDGAAEQPFPDGQVHGSIPYMPPEAFDRHRGSRLTSRVQTAWDLWSCGVVIYVMLSGDLPYGESVEAICSGEPPDFSSEAWKEVSPEAINLICGLLNPDPEARWTARQALGHAWLRSSDAGARPPPPADAAGWRLPRQLPDGLWASPASSQELAHRLLRDLQRWRRLPKLRRLAIAAIARRLDADHPSMRLAQAAYQAFNTNHDKLRCSQLINALHSVLSEVMATTALPPASTPAAAEDADGTPRTQTSTFTGLHVRQRVRGAIRRRFSRVLEDTPPTESSPFAQSPGTASIDSDDLVTLTTELEYLVDSLDGSKDGIVDYTLLVAAILPPDVYCDEARITEAFEMFDIKNCGKITPGGLQTYLRTAMKSREVRTNIFSQMIAEFDRNGDGALDIKEFRMMLQVPETWEDAASRTPLTDALTPCLDRLSPGPPMTPTPLSRLF